MNHDRTLSALISRLEALSAQEIIGNAKRPSSLTAAGDASDTALAGTRRRAMMAWVWFVLGGLLAASLFAGYRWH
jgi:hypothetical protein